MAQILQFYLDFDQDLAEYIKNKFPTVENFRILSKSLDARKAPQGKKPIFHYRIEAISQGEQFSKLEESFDQKPAFKKKPIWIGAGPASLFGALRLTEYGIPSTIIERGARADERMLHISKYWKKGILNQESNVCFGEGGAGLFSDGKLITRVKSPLVKYVMKKFVDFGAPEETGYISNPHLGSNKIRKIINQISDHLKAKDCEIIYDTRVDEVLFENNKVVGVKLSDGRVLESDNVIFGAGHSAHELYEDLVAKEVDIKAKDFAVGVRVEHKREVIDKIQHGEFSKAPELGSARYRLSFHNHQSEKGTYSFCMCPGGYVLSSGTHEGALVCNGMSNYSRNSPWSNAALVVSIQKSKDFGDEVLDGLKFQIEIEKKAFELSKREATGRELPAITIGEFLAGKVNHDKELPKTSCPSKLFKADFNQIFPKFIVEHLKSALKMFDQNMKGFAHNDALLIAPETRTSAPVTILRDKKTLESTSHKGFYPCGEGAGYAGGITSAAVDGIRVAESLIEYKRENK